MSTRATSSKRASAPFVGTAETREWLEDKLARWRSERLLLVSPFITKGALSKIDEAMGRSSKKEVVIVTNIEALSIVMGSLDVEALADLLDRRPRTVSIFHVSDLHAKVFLFEGRSAVVGSANLTNAGLGRNLELGVEASGRRELEFLQSRITEWISGLPCQSANQLRERGREAEERLGKLKNVLRADDDTLPSFPSESISKNTYFEEVVAILDLLRRTPQPREQISSVFANKKSDRRETHAPARRLALLQRLGLVQVSADLMSTTELGVNLCRSMDKRLMADLMVKEYPVIRAVCEVVNERKIPLTNKGFNTAMAARGFGDQLPNCQTAKRWAVHLGRIEIVSGSAKQIRGVRAVNKGKR